MLIYIATTVISNSIKRENGSGGQDDMLTLQF